MADTVEEIRKMDEQYRERTRALTSDAGSSAGKDKASGANTEKAKTCSTCKEIKPLSEFYKRAKNKDGLRYSCKKCVRRRAKDYSQRKRAEKPKKGPSHAKADEYTKISERIDAGNGKDLRLVVDFADYPELYERLAEEAEADIRPVNMQALYLIRKTLG